MKKRDRALEIAKTRELFFWMSAFSVITTGGLISRYTATKRSSVLAPILPMAFVVAYYADLSYGTKINRINAEADMIMNHEEDLLELDLPTVSELDQARIETDEKVFLHPHQN